VGVAGYGMDSSRGCVVNVLGCSGVVGPRTPALVFQLKEKSKNEKMKKVPQKRQLFLDGISKVYQTW